MRQRDAGAAFGEPIGCFESKQSAANDENALALRGERRQHLRIRRVAERMHAGKIGAVQRQTNGARARCEHEFGKGDALAVLERDLTPRKIDAIPPCIQMQQLTPCVAPPSRGLECRCRAPTSPASTEESSTRL